MPVQEAEINVIDCEPNHSTFLEDVVEGLSGRTKRLPCKYFYDGRGSSLFDRICELDEYYLTRSELAIMRRSAGEMANRLGRGVMLIEYGSGSSIKTRLLLDHLRDPAAYVPVDISRRHLLQSASRLSEAYPAIEVLPVCADFTTDFDLPLPQESPSRRAVYFPGSTIGNFAPAEARRLLADIAARCAPGGSLLIGADLKKDVDKLEAAYNDRQGITAEFNRNVLRRINRELGGDFQPEHFRHQAFFNEEHGRIEMHLVSEREQVVSIAQHAFDFSEGESICTEHSHKYTVREFQEMASAADFSLDECWTDERKNFSVLHFTVGS